MTIEYFVFKTWRYASLILVIIFLFLKYYALPDVVAVNFDQIAKPIGYLPKDQIFYLISGLLLFVNIFPTLLIDQIKKMPSSFYSFLPSFVKKHLSTNYFYETFENWINLIIGIVNALLLLAILILSKINSAEYHANINDYSWLTYTALILVFLITVYPFFKLRFLGPKSNIN